MKTAVNPIHWECYVTEPGQPVEKAKVVDLRTLPEEVKCAVLQAALQVGFRYHNGEYDVDEDSEENEALVELTEAVDLVREYMYEVNLTTCP